VAEIRERSARDGALDFDDLLLRAVSFMRNHPEARAQYQARWPYIHIDEYQDTNRIQAAMVELLVGEGRHICAVGDIDQTIRLARTQIATSCRLIKLSRARS